jgi:hypothetical protein
MTNISNEEHNNSNEGMLEKRNNASTKTATSDKKEYYKLYRLKNKDWLRFKANEFRKKHPDYFKNKMKEHRQAVKKQSILKAKEMMFK